MELIHVKHLKELLAHNTQYVSVIFVTITVFQMKKAKNKNLNLGKIK